MEALRLIDAWEAEHAAAGVTSSEGEPAVHGDAGAELWWASVTKPVTALAVLVALEEGTLDLDEPAGPEGATVRHLLAHASGLPVDAGGPTSAVERFRIYSNVGFETLAEALAARAGMPYADYVRAAVLEPLGLDARTDGSAAAGMHGTLHALLRIGRELLAPTLVAPETLAEATTVAFPGLDGVLPGFGRMEPNDWGLGFELRDAKTPHWTGSRNSPRTFGHFGRAGTFLWVDPEAGLACAALTDRGFGDWAKEAWPRLSDAVIAEAA